MRTLKQIIQILEDVDFPPANAMVWIGKNYSKQDLINDLKRLDEKENREVASLDDMSQAPGNSF